MSNITFDVNRYFAELEKAPKLNQLVGGSDGRAVGEASLNLLAANGLPLNKPAVICDFGCGVGRGTAAVTAAVDPGSTVLGIDILPDLVEFCERNIGDFAPNTDFRLLKVSNQHYEHAAKRHKGASAKPQSRKKILTTYRSRVDFLWAFSVLTHLDREGVAETLKFIRRLLAEDGRALITIFSLDSDAQRCIDNGTTAYGLAGGFWEDGMFHADPNDRGAFVGFNPDYFLDCLSEAKLIPLDFIYGTWRDGKRSSSSFQDAVLVGRS